MENTTNTKNQIPQSLISLWQRVQAWVKKNPRLGGVVLLAVVLSLGLTLWARKGTTGTIPFWSSFTKTLQQANPGQHEQRVQTGGFLSGFTITTPTPTPTPRQGPGVYACSPEGVCNLYNDQVRKENCTKTFADPDCLNACANQANRCAK